MRAATLPICSTLVSSAALLSWFSMHNLTLFNDGVEAYSLHFGAFLFQQFLLSQPHWDVQEPTWNLELDPWKRTDTLFSETIILSFQCFCFLGRSKAVPLAGLCGWHWVLWRQIFWHLKSGGLQCCWPIRISHMRIWRKCGWNWIGSWWFLMVLVCTLSGFEKFEDDRTCWIVLLSFDSTLTVWM